MSSASSDSASDLEDNDDHMDTTASSNHLAPISQQQSRMPQIAGGGGVPASTSASGSGTINPEEAFLALAAQYQANAVASSSSGPTIQSISALAPATEAVDGVDGDKPSQAKKPRVRLAHACDRCRRRKIKCDTQLPCTPCQAAKELCQFETPARRPPTKRRAEVVEDEEEISQANEGITAGVTGGNGQNAVEGEKDGVKLGMGAFAGAIARDSTGRPRLEIGSGPGSTAGTSQQPRRVSNLPESSRTASTGPSAHGPNKISSKNPVEPVTNRCIDLSAFEAILRSVSPSMHNALISQLDASLGGNGISNTNSIGSGSETLTPTFSFSDGTTIPGGFNFAGLVDTKTGGAATSSALSPGGSSSPYAFGIGGQNVQTPQQYMAQASASGSGTIPNDGNDHSDYMNVHAMNYDAGAVVRPNFGSGTGSGGRARGKSAQEESDATAADLERALGGMNLSNGYLYLDEIGQTKWQGATSGFPLLDLLTGKAATDAESEAGSSDAASHGARRSNNPLKHLYSHLAAASSPSTRQPASERTLSPDSSSRGDIPTSAGGKNRTSSESEGVSSPRDGETDHTRPSGSTRAREKFFPDRQPRKSQALNPEETWKIITNVIPPDLMDTLVRCYLSTSHLLWPFLHVPSFLADYANPQKWAEPGFACFVVAICTLSSRHVDDPRVRAKVNDPSTAGKAYFELFKRLRDLPSADRPTLYSIQAAYLVAIYAFGLGTLSKAFALLAESVTLCLDGGLHRSVEGYEFFTPIEQEMRKRTFWSIYSWDKQSAALFGKPPLIHLRDCDVPEPLQVDDEYISETEVEPQPAGSQSRLSAFVAVIRLHVVLEGVIDACVTPATFASSPFLSRAASTISRRPAQSMSLAEAETLLEEWVAILPKHWCYDAETVESKDPIRITQAERLHCLQHLVKMIINRQRFSQFVQIPAATAEERGSHLESCKRAMDSALTICANHVHISQRGMMTYFGVHVIHSLAQCGRTLVAVILNCKTPEFTPLIAPATEGLRSCVGLLRRFSGRYLCGLRSADILEEFCRVCNISVDLPSAVIGDGNPSPAWLRPLQRRKSPSPAPPETIAEHSPPAFSPTEESPSAYSQDRRHQQQRNGPDLNMLLVDALDNPASANALLSTQDFFDLSAAASPMVSGGTGSGSNSRQPQEYNSFDGFGALGPATAPFDQFETLAPDATMMDVSGGNGVFGGMNEQDWDMPFASGNDVLGQMSAETILQLMQQGTFSASLQNYA